MIKRCLYLGRTFYLCSFDFTNGFVYYLFDVFGYGCKVNIDQFWSVYVSSYS